MASIYLLPKCSDTGEFSKEIEKMKAWLATWEGTSEDGSRVAFILPPRWSPNRVKEYTTWFYVLHGSSLTEQVGFAKHPNRTPYPAEYTQHPQSAHVKCEEKIICGHNPFLKVRKVMALELKSHKEIEWKELPVPKLSPFIVNEIKKRG